MDFKNIYEHLKYVKTRPWMFIGKPDIQNLFLYVAWYRAFIVFNDLKVDEDPFFWYFHDYIAVISWFEASTSWWANMLQNYYWNGEVALQKFFEHLEDFEIEFKWKKVHEMRRILISKWYEIANSLFNDTHLNPWNT